MSGTLTTNNRAFRFAIGDEAETRFIAKLLMAQKSVYFTGQEFWIPRWAFDIAKKSQDDKLQLVRHFPDLATDRAMIDVKAALLAHEYPTVTLEVASYNACLSLQKCGIPVYIFWMFHDREFHGNGVDRLSPSPSKTERRELNGSMTPMLTVVKKNLASLDTLMDKL